MADMMLEMELETDPLELDVEVEEGIPIGGTKDYRQLVHKPSINGIELNGNVEIPIPSKTSDIDNDSGFITEDDVPTKLSELENDENFAKEDAIPTKVSQLENDANYVKKDDIPEGASISKDANNTLTKGSDNGLYVPPTDLSDYAKTKDIPTVPSNVSDFANDSGYLTADTVKPLMPKKTSELTNDSNFATQDDIPDVSIYALITEAGFDLGLSMDASTYEMTIELKNKAGTILASRKLDFPIESMVVDAEYKDGIIYLKLQSGTTLPVDISKIVSGLVNDTFTIAGIDMKDDITAEELKTALGVVDAYTKAETDNLLKNKADKTAIPDISGKADTSYVNEALSNKVDKVSGKGLSSNDFTNAYKNAIDNLPSSYAPTDAEKNVIIGIQKNGTDITPTNRKVNIIVPTALSGLTDDATHRLVTDAEKDAWNNKADSDNTYTKTEVDEELQKKSNKETGVTAGSNDISVLPSSLATPDKPILQNFTVDLSDSFKGKVDAINEDLFNMADFALKSIAPSNAIKYDDRKIPSTMVYIPKMRICDVLSSTSTAVLPAFIVNGKEIDGFWFGKYETKHINGRAYSQPSVDPTSSANLDTFVAYAKAKGDKWHEVTNAEWAVVALWCHKNGSEPYGNNNYGKDTRESLYKAIPSMSRNSSGRIQRVATGTGPVTWSHDGTVEGIWDMNGNVWEWCTGLRLVYGEVQILADNNAADPTANLSASSNQWKAIKASDGSLITPDGKGTTTGSIKLDWIGGKWTYSTNKTTSTSQGCQFKDVTCDSTISAAAKLLLQTLALMPDTALTGDGIDATYGGDYFYVSNGEAERCSVRGGDWYYGTNAGVFGLGLSNPRSSVGTTVGGRSALIDS